MKTFVYIVLILLCVCALSPPTAYAQEYDLQTLKNYATRFLIDNATLKENAISSSHPLHSVTPIYRANRPYLYVMNAADSAGWVILPNEQAYDIGVIAYAAKGSFSYHRNLPPALLAFLEEHMNAIDSVRLHKVRVDTNEVNTQIKKIWSTTPPYYMDIAGISQIIMEKMIVPLHLFVKRPTINFVPQDGGKST